MDQQIIAIEQLVAGRLETIDSSAAIGSVLTRRIGSNLPVLIRVRGLPGRTCYVLSNARESIYCSGIRCAPEHCLVSDGNVDMALICRTPTEVTLCLIGANAGATHFQRGTHRISGNAEGISRVRALLSSFHDPLEHGASHSLAAQSLGYDLRESLTALSLASNRFESSSSPRAMSVERGRRYIHANLGGALRIASVCEAAGIRSRTLEYGFQELFGVSPVSYIKALRLNHVRRVLSSSSSARRTITAIALDSGFWHLSQFAADYQKFFGESPSITRRRFLSQATGAAA